jgi:hypothetical protein
VIIRDARRGRDVRALDALELHLEHPRRGPLAVRSELDLADDRVELVLVDVVDDLLLVDALRRFHGLPEHLQVGVRERRKVVAQRVHARLLGLRLIALEEVLDAREPQRGLGNPDVEVHDAVQLGAELGEQRGELQADHPGAEHLGP